MGEPRPPFYIHRPGRPQPPRQHIWAQLSSRWTRWLVLPRKPTTAETPTTNRFASIVARWRHGDGWAALAAVLTGPDLQLQARTMSYRRRAVSYMRLLPRSEFAGSRPGLPRPVGSVSAPDPRPAMGRAAEKPALLNRTSLRRGPAARHVSFAIPVVARNDLDTAMPLAGRAADYTGCSAGQGHVTQGSKFTWTSDHVHPF